MIFNISSTRGQTRFLTCVARVTCLVLIKRHSHCIPGSAPPTVIYPLHALPLLCPGSIFDIPCRQVQDLRATYSIIIFNVQTMAYFINTHTNNNNNNNILSSTLQASAHVSGCDTHCNAQQYPTLLLHPNIGLTFSPAHHHVVSATTLSHHTYQSFISAMSATLGLSPKCVQLVMIWFR